LLEALADVQIPANELSQFTKLTSVQTKGLKKHFYEQKYGVKETKRSAKTVNDDDKVTSTVRGKKRTIEEESSDEEVAKRPKDLNVVGVEMSDSSDEDEEMATSTAITETIVTQVVETSPVVEAVKIEEECVSIKEQPKAPIDRKPATYVHVERDQEIQVARLKLPILAEEQVIMETISENNVIILAGSTGSGKTTQVPQFLYEAGYAENGKIIGITEPRRVAAISMSQRVGREMNLSSDIVSYLIRFEGNCTPETKIKFMTDGVLLKEVECDFLLNKYSVIILDEVHERSVYTDILIGLLSRIVQLRKKKGSILKLIVMSATLRVEDFTKNTKLFKEAPPVINVESRQFPVTVHFNKVTADDYQREALIKAIKIHTKLPEGGILIFLTGQQEVKYLVKKLRKLFPYAPKSSKSRVNEEKEEESEVKLDYSDDDDEELDMIFNIRKAIKHKKKSKKNLLSQMTLPKINLDDFRMPGDDTEADFNEDEDEDDLDEEKDEIDERLTQMMSEAGGNSQPLWVLPLYSLLPTHKQSRVFEPPPENTRLCVIATNVAETSLTIPNVKYVIDSGRQKTKFYDKVTGVNSFVVTYTSKAAADQRAGRAGRVAPGHCYRLYSSAVYSNDFVQFSPPEIQQKPIDGLVLQMKAMGIEKVINFPFPSPPDRIQLEVSEKRLKILGALDNHDTAKITKLGSSIASFPVAPRFGKMLALSHQQKLLEYTICMVAALSVQEVLQEVPLAGENGESNSNWRSKRRALAGSANSLLLGDPMILLKSIGAAEYAHSQGKLQKFCDENGLRMKGVLEIRKLRMQLTNEINLNVPNLSLVVNPKMEPPTDQQAKMLRQILLSGLGDQVARKIPDEELKLKEDKHKLKYAYQIPDLEEPVNMHSCSILKKKQPEWVVYQEIFETRSGDDTKMFLRGITAIEPEWLLKFAPGLCNFTKTLEDPEPRYESDEDKIFCHVKATFGRSGWPLPIAEMEMPESLDKYRHFAKFLLEGTVIDKLAEFRKHLLSTPSTMTKSWSKIVPRTEMTMNALANKQVDSREKLLKELKVNANCESSSSCIYQNIYLVFNFFADLLKQYLMWIPEALHFKVTSLWPELLN
jgi:ATP-dependent RNA helicase DHX37/DHR1